MSWPVVALGDVADTALGKMLDKGKDSGQPRVHYLRNVNVQWGRIDTDDLLTMELADDERERFEVRAGDLLVCEGGEIGRAAIWNGRSEYIAFQKALHRVRPSEALDTRFLRYLLERHAQNGVLARLATGSTIAHLPQQQLRKVPVPLPTLGEQHRIVELLEDHLSRLDAASSTLDQCVKKLGAMRESFLARTVCEAGAVPGSRIVPLGKLAQVLTGATPRRGNRAYYDGGTIPWITSGDLHQGNIVAATQYVTEKALNETNIKLVPAGALLVAMYGEGRTRGTVAELGLSATTNQACAAIVPHDPELRPWIRIVLEANYGAMRRMSAGGVQPNLNLSLLRSIGVPIPPKSLQGSVIQRMIAIDSCRTRLKQEIEAARVRSDRLRRGLMTAAFSGRLTKSSDELLEELVSV